MLLRNGSNIGDAWNAGIDQARQDQANQMKIAAAQKAAQDQQAARTGIAAALANGDLKSAAAIAYSYGADKVGDGLTTLQKNGYDQGSAGATSFGDIARGVAALPYEQRKGAIQSAKPSLVAHGFSSADIDAFDPTDANIAAVSGQGYSAHDRASDNIGAVNAQTDQYKAQTGRIDTENPVVVGGSLVTRSGQELYRAPQYVTAPLDNNLYQMPGTDTGGYSQTANPPGDAYGRMVGAEGGTNPDGSFRTSPKGAVGPAQVMPTTGPEAAADAGLPWDAQRYATDPQYNLAIGRAYFGKLLQRYGGDQVKASAAYNAGPTRVDAAIQQGGQNWQAYVPPETRGYISKVYGQTPLTRQPQLIQQGQAKQGGQGSYATRQLQAQQQAYDSYDRAIRTAQELLNHPGLPAAVGSGFDPHSWGSFNPMTGQPFGGTNAADFDAKLTALKSQVFLPMVQALRGMGQLSNSEGEKLTAAIGALDTTQSETAFKSSLNQVIGDLSFYRDRAGQQLRQSQQGGGGQAQAGSQPSASSPPAAAVQMLQSNHALRAQFDAKYGDGASASVLGY
jgi:hypothetical protein